MFRRFLGIVSFLPGLCALALLPIAVFRGDIKHPQILLSDFMDTPGYKEVVCLVLLVNCATNVYLMIEVLRYTRGWASREVMRPIDVAVCLQVSIFPAFLLVVFFPFGQVGLYWALHCFGCLWGFMAIAGGGLVQVFFIAPKLSKTNIVPEEDAMYRRWCGISVCVLVVVAAVVRSLHFADNAGWAWSLLAAEIAFGLLWNLSTVLGNWRTLGELDRIDPVAFAPCPNGKDDRLSGKKAASTKSTRSAAAPRSNGKKDCVSGKRAVVVSLSGKRAVVVSLYRRIKSTLNLAA